MTSPSDELKAAVARLRTARFTGAVTMTPTVAGLIRAREPIAKWLDDARTDAEHLSRATGSSPDQCLNPHALAVARAINTGGQP